MGTTETEKKTALGRGLASLIPGASTQGGGKAVKKEFFQCDIEKIVPNTYQPRKIFEKEALQDLVDSVKVHGIMQPLVVRIRDGHYELIAGERRWRAAQKAGLSKVPVVVKDVPEDQTTLSLALIENIQRSDLNCIEEAIAFQQLMDEFQLNQEQVAKEVGKNRSTVANTLRLLKLPAVVREDLTSSKLTMGHARALLSLEKSEDQINLRDQIIREKLSVRETESRVNGLLKSKSPQAEKETSESEVEKDANVKALQEKLQRQFGTKVKIAGSQKKGTIQITYSNAQELVRISDLLVSEEN